MKANILSTEPQTLPGDFLTSYGVNSAGTGNPLVRGVSVHRAQHQLERLEWGGTFLWSS